MNILIGDTIVRPSHDTLKAGRISSLNIYVPFNLKDGVVVYANKYECENGMDEGNNLRLRLEPLIDNPKIDGIVMMKGTLKGKSQNFPQTGLNELSAPIRGHILTP
jgi:hypothetical protein